MEDPGGLGDRVQPDRVSFTVKATGEKIPKNPLFQLELRCENQTAVQAEIKLSDRSVTKAHEVAGRLCEVRALGGNKFVLGQEVAFTIRQGEDVLTRRVIYPQDGEGEVISTDFFAPHGELQVEVSHEFTGKPLGTRLRVMTWNILHGGRDAGGETNVRQIGEFIRNQDPDVLVTVETYGSGNRILDVMNAGQPPDRLYKGIQITREPGQEVNRDNLWIFTRFPVVKLYPLHRERIHSLHFGGVRIRLPDNQEMNVFATWLYQLEHAGSYTNKTVNEIRAGTPRTYTDEEIVGTDKKRLEWMNIIQKTFLPLYLNGDKAPTIMAGDFNTLSNQDWSRRFAHAPGHAGLVLDWPVTKAMQEAGFTDSYRWANPDASRFQGRTTNPLAGYGTSPSRIDYIWTSGDSVRILDSFTRDRRLPEHSSAHLFYSDHAPVITDMMIRHP
ncbi:hypothetical protein PAESOLCIP111_06732 [Paenibacillus solanacearum]|uniref:Endonuclease/exonuclease/phosphatase domain-containing protein n=1 Tax=Paenibacillus solanacearum TaxID=2048548 RepID=A0A916KB54_9BACL|nr:endonuclease/exonuclease/phosphatase family protein [Paenibacillus solanacearum]CAG7653280.1 hypothetical protein PAESOLCIP111_06732 [Paenibacillus solanacearum]